MRAVDTDAIAVRMYVALRASRRPHIYTGDWFVSCPKSPEFVNNETAQCRCGADEYNRKLDKLLKVVERHKPQWVPAQTSKRGRFISLADEQSFVRSVGRAVHRRKEPS